MFTFHVLACSAFIFPIFQRTYFTFSLFVQYSLYRQSIIFHLNLIFLPFIPLHFIKIRTPPYWSKLLCSIISFIIISGRLHFVLLLYLLSPESKYTMSMSKSTDTPPPIRTSFPLGTQVPSSTHNPLVTPIANPYHPYIQPPPFLHTPH